jgi:hypothetical protein
MRHLLPRRTCAPADTAGTLNEVNMHTATNCPTIDNTGDKSSAASRRLIPVLAAMALAVLGAYVMVLNDAVDRGQAVRAAFAAGQFATEEPPQTDAEPLLASAGDKR